MAKQFDLGKVVGDAPIDDVTPSSTKVYSSQRVEDIASQLSQQKADKDGVLRSDPQEGGGAPEMGSVPINADQLGGMTFQMIVDLIYPIGRTITTLDDSDNPNTLYPWQVWERTAKGRMIIGTGAPEDNDDGTSPGSYNMALSSKGGEATHKLIEAELPVLSGSYDLRPWGNNGGALQLETKGIITRTRSTLAQDGVSSSGSKSEAWKTAIQFGGDQPHNNMPPYIAANIWKRVA